MNCKSINITFVKAYTIRLAHTAIAFSSVADPVFFGHLDPDPDPGKYRIRIRILYPQKDPMLFKFSCYKIV